MGGGERMGLFYFLAYSYCKQKGDIWYLTFWDTAFLQKLLKRKHQTLYYVATLLFMTIEKWSTPLFMIAVSPCKTADYSTHNCWFSLQVSSIKVWGFTCRISLSEWNMILSNKDINNTYKWVLIWINIHVT